MINFQDFKNIDLRVAEILQAERVEGSDKLLKLQINLGPINLDAEAEKEERQIIAGIGKSYQPEDLIGKEIIVIVNLEPKIIFGLESQGMLLAAEDGNTDEPILLVPDKFTSPGSKIH